MSAQLQSEPDTAVLSFFQNHTYAETAEQFACSVGSVWRIVQAADAFKTRERRAERAEERKRRTLAQFKELLDQTVTSDVIAFLRDLPDEAVHIAVTSPPFNVGKAYDGIPGDRTMRALYYEGWLTCIVSELARILKPGGTAFLEIGTTKDDDERRIPLDVLLFPIMRRANLDYASRIVWPTPHGLTPRRRVAERYETALIFSKPGASQTFNPAPGRLPQKYPGKRAFHGPRIGELTGHPQGSHPSDVWDDVRHLRHNDGEKVESHPAQFPIAIARKAILMYSMPGDVVLDPFSGSGSTQIAALQTGRHFIGADLFYGEVRRDRLASIEPDRVSLLPGVSEDNMAVWQAEARRREIPALPFTENVA